MRKQLAAGLLVTAVCLYFAFRGLSVRDTFEVIRTANAMWIALAMLVYAAGFLIRAVRWEVLIRPITVVDPTRLFPIMMIGFLANNVLPFRMGEFVRAHLTGRKFRISRTASLGTILVERLFDTVSFLTTFVATTLFFRFPPMVQKAAWALAATCLGLVLALAMLVFRRTWFDWIVERSPFPKKWKTTAGHLAENFTRAVAPIFKLRFFILVMALSLVVWTGEGTVLYLIAHAFPDSLGYPQAFFVLFFLGIAVTLPQAPGFVGTLELFGVTAMGVLGIPKENAMPVILTIHGCQFIFILAVGLACLWSEGLSLTSLRRESPSALRTTDP